MMTQTGAATVPIAIERENILHEESVALIRALNAELSARYPEEGASHFRLNTEEVSEGRGAFFVIRGDGVPLGCGAVRRINQVTAELKRMYVVPQFRGRGLARRLLDALEAEAKKMGISQIVLETGIRQPEAIALYTRAGFRNVPAFGEYVDSPLSVCMAKAV